MVNLALSSLLSAIPFLVPTFVLLHTHSCLFLTPRLFFAFVQMEHHESLATDTYDLCEGFLLSESAFDVDSDWTPPVTPTISGFDTARVRKSSSFSCASEPYCRPQIGSMFDVSSLGASQLASSFLPKHDIAPQRSNTPDISATTNLSYVSPSEVEEDEVFETHGVERLPGPCGRGEAELAGGKPIFGDPFPKRRSKLAAWSDHKRAKSNKMNEAPKQVKRDIGPFDRSTMSQRNKRYLRLLRELFPDEFGYGDS